MAVDDHRVRLETGRGLGTRLPDAVTRTIVDTVITPRFAVLAPPPVAPEPAETSEPADTREPTDTQEVTYPDDEAEALSGEPDGGGSSGSW